MRADPAFGAKVGVHSIDRGAITNCQRQDLGRDSDELGLALDRARTTENAARSEPVKIGTVSSKKSPMTNAATAFPGGHGAQDFAGLQDPGVEAAPRKTEVAVRTSAVGIAVLDQVFLVPELPTRPAKYLASGYREILGGMAANAAAAAARLGARSRLVSRIGDDNVGSRIVEELRALGVLLDEVERVSGVRSSRSAVMIDGSGERLLVNYTPEELLERAPAPPISIYGEFDAVLVDGRWPAAAVRALELARSRRVPGLADLDHPMREPEATALLEAASHIAFSRDGLVRWTGEVDTLAGLAAIRQRTRADVAVTLGGNGVLFVAEDRFEHLPAFSVRAVDTLGAGDTFHGALLVALAEQQAGWREALLFAAAAAALRCARPGGRSAFPTRAAVEALLAADRTDEVSV